MLATGWRVLVHTRLAFFLLFLIGTSAMAAAVRDGQIACLGYAEMEGVRRAILRDIGPDLLKLLALGERLNDACAVSAIGEAEVELQCDQPSGRLKVPLGAVAPPAGPPPGPVEIAAGRPAPRPAGDGSPPARGVSIPTEPDPQETDKICAS